MKITVQTKAIQAAKFHKSSDFAKLETWADMMESRDDIGFEDEKLNEVIFELANPEINGEITEEKLKRIIKVIASFHIP